MAARNRFCDRCGAAIPSTESRYCSSCGAEVASSGAIPAPMAQRPDETPITWKIMGTIIFIISGVVLVIALISYLSSSSGSGLPEGPAEKVDLRSMLILYESNKLDAEEKYKGKLVRMQGSVKHIDDDYIEIIPYPSDQFQQSGARCNVLASERSKISGLVEQDLFKGRWGTVVTIRGKHKGFSGFIYTVAKIDRCQINPGPEPKPEPKASTQDTTAGAGTSRDPQRVESGQTQALSGITDTAPSPRTPAPTSTAQTLHEQW